MPADFETYFRALAEFARDEKTVHTDRGALRDLLQAACERGNLRMGRGMRRTTKPIGHSPKRAF